MATKIISTYIAPLKKAYWISVIVVVSITILSKVGIGENIAEMLTYIQAGLTLFVFHYIFTMFLFRKYKNSDIQRVMENSLVSFLRWVLFIIITIILVYGLGYFAVRVWHANS